MSMGMGTGQGWAGTWPRGSQNCRDCGRTGQSCGALHRPCCSVIASGSQNGALGHEQGWGTMEKKSASLREESYQKINMHERQTE